MFEELEKEKELRNNRDKNVKVKVPTIC